MRTIAQTTCCTLIALWACTNAPAKKPPAATGIACSAAAQKMYALSNTRPSLVIPVPADTLLKKPETLTLQVKEVNNPALLPVHLVIGFSAATRQWQAGNFTLYPPDKPGTFVIRIDKVVAAMLTNSAPATTTPYHLHITLDTTGFTTTGKPASPVRVELCAPVFK